MSDLPHQQLDQAQISHQILDLLVILRQQAQRPVAG
jgi:hypothetical protein